MYGWIWSAVVELDGLWHIINRDSPVQRDAAANALVAQGGRRLL